MSKFKNQKPKDIDDALRQAKDKTVVLQNMKADAKDVILIEYNSQKNNKAYAKKKDCPSEELLAIDSWQFESVVPVCELGDNLLVVFSSINFKFYLFKANDLKYPLLLQMGGEEVYNRVYRRTEHKTDQRNISFDSVRDILILHCRRLQLGSAKWHGQGIHRLADRKVLILSGGQALLYNGRDSLPYSDPILDGKLVEYDGGRSWINLDSLSRKLHAMTHPEAKRIVNELIKFFGQWGFSGLDTDLTQFVAAFLALVVHNFWTFKAHVYVSGRAGSGKTLLLTMIQRLLGSGIARRREGSILTSAGLVQEAGHDAGIFLIDEFERSKSREDILMVARSTGRGGTVGSKGTANQKAILVEINCAMFLCSIDRALHEEAEIDRYILFDLQKDISRKPIVPEEHTLTDFRESLFAFCLWAAFRAEQMIQAVGSVDGIHGRSFEAYAPGLAMLTVGMGGNVEMFRNMLIRILYERRNVGGVVIADENRLLNDILSLRIRVPIEVEAGDDSKTKYGNRTIGQLLDSNDEHHLRELEAHGVKLCPDGVFLVPEMLKGQLKNTEWEQRGLKTYLKRLNNAQEKQRRCGGGHGREGVLVPLSLVLAE